jgi:hypothetical protein
LRIRIAPGFWTSRVGLAVLGSVLFVFLAATSVFAYYYVQFGKLIDQRLTGQVFQNTSRVFSAPGHIFVGEAMHASDLATYLLRAGYQEGEAEGALGWFKVKGPSVEIHPSSASYFRGGNALRVDFSGGAISRIVDLSATAPRDSAEIEPEPV